MYQISFYVPESHLETVKQAMFAAGAGRIGNYDSCVWQCLGQGQYRPLDGSQPFAGQADHVHHCDEYKVEMVCRHERLAAALAALKASHPYEMPAYFVFHMTNPANNDA